MLTCLQPCTDITQTCMDTEVSLQKNTEKHTIAQLHSHSHDLTSPALLDPHDEHLHAPHLDQLQRLCVKNSVLPGYSHDFWRRLGRNQSRILSCLLYLYLCFTAIEQKCLDSSLVNCTLLFGLLGHAHSILKSRAIQRMPLSLQAYWRSPCTISSFDAKMIHLKSYWNFNDSLVSSEAYENISWKFFRVQRQYAHIKVSK